MVIILIKSMQLHFLSNLIFIEDSYAIWSTDTILQRKLDESKRDLEKIVSFILKAGLKVQSS